mmetsp:Transcript_51765/g.112521  ORF Transcript_51765/g.112521 Transcript_51765/m.112521 type:complete len:244 (-) Transcript_51765:243-974(-)
MSSSLSLSLSFSLSLSLRRWGLLLFKMSETRFIATAEVHSAFWILNPASKTDSACSGVNAPTFAATFDDNRLMLTQTRSLSSKGTTCLIRLNKMPLMLRALFKLSWGFMIAALWRSERRFRQSPNQESTPRADINFSVEMKATSLSPRARLSRGSTGTDFLGLRVNPGGASIIISVVGGPGPGRGSMWGRGKEPMADPISPNMVAAPTPVPSSKSKLRSSERSPRSSRVSEDSCNMQVELSKR